MKLRSLKAQTQSYGPVATDTKEDIEQFHFPQKLHYRALALVTPWSHHNPWQTFSADFTTLSVPHSSALSRKLQNLSVKISHKLYASVQIFAHLFLHSCS